MTDQRCVVIDDVTHALSLMTDLGRSVVGPSAGAIRDSVLRLAVRRNWIVLDYAKYSRWALALISRDELPWFVLDPLLPLDDLHPRARRMRLTRQLDHDSTFIRRVYIDAGGIPSSGSEAVSSGVGVLDDAAASGGTLEYVARLMSQAGAHVKHVAVAASSREARDRAHRWNRTVHWSEHVPGDSRVMHLRDGCPHLPFSAKPSGQPSIPAANGTAVELRVPCNEVVGSLWQVVHVSEEARAATREARSAIARELSRALGREARLSDLSLLGPNVPALVRPGDQVVGDPPIEAFDLAEAAGQRQV